MQVAIYATEEKRRRTGFDHVLVLARRGEALILRRDRINACWVLPEGQLARGQSAEEAARSALGEAVGEAVFDVYPLCAYGVTEENGKESGGFCYVADVREWPDEAADEARAFDRLPLSSRWTDLRSFWRCTSGQANGLTRVSRLSGWVSPRRFNP
ncbi:MAG: hypothetical protein ACLVJB_01695 [Christensenellales bacterium]